MTNQRSARALEALTRAVRGVAHPARLRILSMLSTGELCACQLIAVLGLAPSTVSRHLDVLRRGGWIAERKDGKWVHYRLEANVSASLAAAILEALASDPLVRADRTLVARLRRIPVSRLCAADLDLVTLGVRSRASSGATA